MYNSPFFNSPFNNYRRPGYNNKFKSNFDNFSNESFPAPITKNSNFEKKTDEKKDSSHQTNSSSNIFNIFGISLYLDDIILLLIIYFLYTEDTKDELLFCVLILLFIS